MRGREGGARSGAGRLPPFETALCVPRDGHLKQFRLPVEKGAWINLKMLMGVEDRKNVACGPPLKCIWK